MLLKDKWLWFNGKMDEETIKEKGWSDDPFDGLKIMKNDMQIFFNADKDLQKLNAQTEYQQIQIDFLKRCMENIMHCGQCIFRPACTYRDLLEIEFHPYTNLTYAT